MKYLKAVRIQGLQTRLQRDFASISSNEKIVKLKIEEEKGNIKSKGQRMGYIKSNPHSLSVGNIVCGESELTGEEELTGSKLLSHKIDI